MRKNIFVTIIFILAFVVSACGGSSATAPVADVSVDVAVTDAPTSTPTPAATTTADPFYSGTGDFKSGSGSAEVMLRFINNTDKLLLINWVNFEGVEEPFTQVSAGFSIDQSTFSTHAWRVTDEAGNVLAEIVATKDKLQVFEFGPDLTVVYQPTPPPAPTIGPDIPVTERATGDRPDDFPGMYQVHLLYVIPSDAKDRQVDTDGSLGITTNAINEWFSGQTGGTKVRFDTYKGELDVTFVQLDMTSEEFYAKTVETYGTGDANLNMLEATLERMRVLHPGKIYVAIFDIDRVDNSCADGKHPPENMGRLAGHYPVAIWSVTNAPCSDETFGVGYKPADMGMIHEITHVLGFASDCGKNPTNENNTAHTGDDIRDLMNAPDEGDTEWWDVENMALDPGNDDYYNHDIPNCADLADSAFLDPLPANPQLPENWYEEWKLP